MALQKPISHRKAASYFINDNNDHNLIQLSPHRESCNLEQLNSYTVTSNQNSKTNFIGESILVPKRSRAIAVTKTGEKHLLDLDASPLATTSSIPFTSHSPRILAPTMEKISEESFSQLYLTETMSKNSIKLNKKPKHPKLSLRHKQRLVFTPRKMETTSSTQLLSTGADKGRSTIKQTHSMTIGKSENISTETQTEDFPYFSSSLYIPRHFQSTNATTCLNYIPMEGPRNYLQEVRNNFQKPYAMEINPPVVKPLKIYTKYSPSLRKYTELRSVASAVTLVTVFCWLVSTFFDVKFFWDYLDDLWKYFQNWFLTKEKPKTKLEILASFLQDLWF